MNESALYIGTSGWTYDHWKGVFYPADIKKREWLTFYAERFDTVELNASFYRIPKIKAVEGWRDRTPEKFHFAVKVSRLISHIKRLKECDKEAEWFFSVFKPLEPKIGAYLVQLPPSLTYDPERIESFIERYPSDIPLVFEFRNNSWYNDETYTLFRKKNLAFCIHDMHGSATDRIVTSDCAYIRFHGYTARYGGDYPDEILADWAAWIRGMRREVKRMFCYFNNDFQGYAIKNCLRLLEMATA